MKKIVTGRPVDDRSEEEKAAAREMDLPAGSFDAKDLSKVAKMAPEKQADALSDLDETPKPSGEMAGYVRAEVEDKELGITENRFIPAPEAQEPPAKSEDKPSPAKPAASSGTPASKE